jgi:16S rRNA (uracil1498-N3)-methyltransferase
MPTMRALPRIFLPGADLSEPVELPPEEADKLRKVLRLSSGDPIAVLPDDGSLWRCRLEGKTAIPEAQEWPDTEPLVKLTIAQALPKGDRLETVLRMGTEVGVSRFIVFPAERSVVRWEPTKLDAKLKRLRAIVREAAEQSYRCFLPTVEAFDSLAELLLNEPKAIVLSEAETEEDTLMQIARDRIEGGERQLLLVVGPEGGWAPREIPLFGGKGVTMGPLVMRTDTAGIAAAAAVLIGLRPPPGEGTR